MGDLASVMRLFWGVGGDGGGGGTKVQWTFWVYCDSADILEND